MKLVGANNWFIRAPFILENVISGLVACVVATIVIYGILSFLQPHLTAFFGFDFNISKYFNDNFIKIFASELIGITVLNVISSSLALTKYLKV